jgi:fluoride ion exporter CrcB/FEX
MTYWHQGKFGAFALNLFANNLLCFIAVILGIRLHRG